MPYAVIISTTAGKQFHALDRQVQRRVAAKLESLEEVPRPSGCVKLVGYRDVWRVRVGDYRVVYEVDDAHERVHVTLIAHRREAYRGL